MRNKILEHIKKSMFVGSFKAIDSGFFYSVLLDIVWVLLLAGILALTGSVLKANISDITGLAPDLERVMGQLALEDPGTAAQATSIQAVMQTAFTKLISVVIVAIVAIISVSALLKGLVWNKLKLNKFSKEFVKRFFLLNIWWIPVWLIIIALLALLFKPEVSKLLVTIAALAFLHLTTISSTLFDGKKTQIKKAFAIGIKKLHMFIVPYVLAAIILSILASILYPLMLTQINLIVLISIFVIVFLFFEAWVRKYISIIVKNLG